MSESRDTGHPPLSIAFGWSLVSAGVLGVFFMLHHPVASDDSVAERMASIEGLRGLSGWVHGLLCAILLVIWAGLTGLGRRLGWHRFSTVFGGVCVSAGSLLYVGAAMISGFVTPMAAAGLAAGDLHQARETLSLLWSCNQALANAGAVGTSLAISAFSWPLMARPGLARWTGAAGFFVGAGCIISLLVGLLTLDVRGMTGVTIAHSTWYVLAGICLLGPLRKPDQQ